MTGSPTPTSSKRRIDPVTRGWLVIAGLAVVLVALSALTVPRLLASAAPTPPCVTPSLSLNPARYTLLSEPKTAEGALPAAATGADNAAWVAGTNAPYVLVLPDSAQTRFLKVRLTPGTPAVITWADCGREDYQVTSVEPRPADTASLLAQTGPGIVLVAPDFVARGARPGLPGTPDEPPTAVPSGIQSQVTFLENGVTPDGAQIHMRIQVANTGKQAFTIPDGGISLAKQDGSPVQMVGVQPALPVEVKPGGKVELAVDFLNPKVKVLVFRMLDFSVELYY